MKESQQVEWKESWRDEYLRWICGFANAEGGMLVIGRNDKGVAVGVVDSRKLLEDLPNKIRDVLGIMADVRLVKERGKDLVEIRVEPYSTSGSTKQELKGAALERFLLKKRGRHWDDVPEPSFTARSCSAAALRLFKQRATESGRMDPVVLRDSREVILGNLELIEKHGLKRAACLGKHPSCPFNPLLANAFFRAGYIESWGRGIEKIHRECREHGIEPPVYDFGMAGLMLTFRSNPAHLQAVAPEQDRGTTPITAQETAQEKMLTLLQAQPSITRKELASRLGLSDSGIKYHLEKMKAAGVIRHVGATKAGYWEILK